VLLGRHGTPESRAEYARVIAEWEAGGRRLPARAEPSAPDLTVNEVLLQYWHWAERHYRDADGNPSREPENLRLALRPLKALYGHTPARDFGPLALRAVREAMVKAGLCRGVVNARVNRVRRAFRWAVGMELLPPSVLQALQTVPGLHRGGGEAREAEGVAPVAPEHVEAALPHMPAPVAAMVRVQLHSGCRAGEAMVMRACDIDRSGPVWCYRPHRHKGRHRGRDRVIFLGAQARAALRPFLRVTCPRCGLTDFPDRLAWRGELCGPCCDLAEEYGICGPWPQVLPPGDYFLFSPRRYVEDLHARRAAARKTKRTPSESRRQRKRAPKRRPSERYDRRSYRVAVGRACEKAGVPGWSPLQLRHTAATLIRQRYGVEAARVVLGHSKVETSQIYAERDLGAAQRIMAEVG
jgi:integrase